MPKAIWKNVKYLLLPYALFSVCYLFFTHDGIGIESKRLFFGTNPLADTAPIGAVTLLPILFATKIIYLFIERYAPNEKWKALSVLGLSVLGVYLGKRGCWLPLYADCAMYALIFYYLGNYMRRHGVMECIFRQNYLYFALSCVWVYMIYSGGAEITIRNYGTYGLSVLGAVSAAILLFMVCSFVCQRWNSRFVGLLCQAEKHAVYILITHALLAEYIGKIVSLKFTNGNVFYAAVIVLIQLLAGILVGNLAVQIHKHLFRTAAHPV